LLLWAVMPDKSTELWRALSLQIEPGAGDLHALAVWGGLAEGQRVQKTALFPRIERASAGAAPAVRL